MVTQPPDYEHIDEQMAKLEVNLDNTPGEWLGYVMDLLFEAGANDVFYSPIYMKKNRPAVMLQLLCPISKIDEMKSIIFRETTTLGIRYYPLTVHRLARKFYRVETIWGPVTVKEGFSEGQLVQYSPEYEECRAIARENGVPLKTVYDEVWRQYRHSVE